VHADHLSAAPYIQERLGGKIGIGARITVVQEVFGKVFNEGTEFRRDARARRGERGGCPAGLTLVGSGVWAPSKVISTNAQWMPSGVEWVREAAAEVDPVGNRVPLRFPGGRRA